MIAADPGRDGGTARGADGADRADRERGGQPGEDPSGSPDSPALVPNQRLRRSVKGHSSSPWQVGAESPNKRRWVCDRAVLRGLEEAAESYRHGIATFNRNDIFS